MNTYTLTASDNEGKTVVRITAENEEEAIFAGIAKTLDSAIQSERWAKGRITLTDNTGKLIQEMQAK
jgi:nitrate reductase NapAB chaperone NapD